MADDTNTPVETDEAESKALEAAMGGTTEMPPESAYDRFIPEYQGGPPTARNFGWYEQYLPEQRYLSYLVAYSTLTGSTREGNTDQFLDMVAWILGHAAYDQEAVKAGMEIIAESGDSEQKQAMMNWHDRVFGRGVNTVKTSDGRTIDVPKIDPDDPDGTIEAFIRADIDGLGGEPVSSALGRPTMTENTINRIIALWDPKAADEINAPNPNSGERSLAQLWDQIQDEAQTPEQAQGFSGDLRNLAHYGSKAFSDIAVAFTMGGMGSGSSMGYSWMRTPAAGVIGKTRAAVATSFHKMMMGIGERSAVSPIAQGMKEVIPLGLRRSAVRTMARLANSLEWAKSPSAPAPVRWATGHPVKAVNAAGAAGTYGYEGVYKPLTMPIGDIDIGDVVSQLPEGEQKEYVTQLLTEAMQRRQQQEGGG